MTCGKFANSLGSVCAVAFVLPDTVALDNHEHTQEVCAVLNRSTTCLILIVFVIVSSCSTAPLLPSLDRAD